MQRKMYKVHKCEELREENNIKNYTGSVKK